MKKSSTRSTMNAKINKLKIENHSDNKKSIIASAPISGGEAILFVPNHQLMTFERFKDWPSGAEIIKKKPSQKIKPSRELDLGCLLSLRVKENACFIFS